MFSSSYIIATTLNVIALMLYEKRKVEKMVVFTKDDASDLGD